MNGRPQKEINWTLFEDLCSLQCTQKEICAVMHIHRETLKLKVEEHYEEEYSVVFERLSESGKASLRRMQFKIAKRHAGMAIFLGKQWLGQKDNEAMIQIPPEMMENYKKLMNQLSQLQVDAQTKKELSTTAEIEPTTINV